MNRDHECEELIELGVASVETKGQRSARMTIRSASFRSLDLATSESPRVRPSIRAHAHHHRAILPIDPLQFGTTRLA